jgi:hypothetical protein
MAGLRIDINDGRNNPVQPLTPPGGGSIPVSGAPQSSNEATTAQVIGDVVTGGTSVSVDLVYNPAPRTIDFEVNLAWLRRQVLMESPL